MSADLLARLIACGTPAELVGEVAMALAKAEAAAAAQVEAAMAPTKGALRMRRYRERHTPSPSVTSDAGDAQVTESVTDPAPSPPPLLSPQTPQTTPPPLPHPENSDASTREGRPVRAKSRWPRAMPPPAGVSEEQWVGFIEHRKAKRQPLTDRAYQLLTNRLTEHANDEWPPGRIVDLIVERGWLTFEPHWITRTAETRNVTRAYHDRPSGPIEARRRAREQYGVDDGDGACPI